MLGIDLIQNDPRPRCTSSIVIEGAWSRCDYAAEHDGWAHASNEAKAIWK